MGDCSIFTILASFSFIFSLKRPKTVFRSKRQVDLIVLIYFPCTSVEQEQSAFACKRSRASA